MQKQISQKIFIKVVLKTNGRCFYCNNWGEEVEHFISKYQWKKMGLASFLGDVNQFSNLFLSCGKCNSQKNKKLPEVFTGNEFKVWDRYERANIRTGLFFNHPRGSKSSKEAGKTVHFDLTSHLDFIE